MAAASIVVELEIAEISVIVVLETTTNALNVGKISVARPGYTFRSWPRSNPLFARLLKCVCPGRESGEIRLEVVEHADRATLEDFVERTTADDVLLYTDEWAAYNHVPETGRGLGQVCHAPGRREWARDDDGDGIREVHNNTLEGIWTGLRNFLRIFRGISKWYLGQYVAQFEWTFNLKTVTDDFLRALVGRSGQS